MKPTFFKTNAHLLVCVDGRCAERGSRQLFQNLWRELEGERLAYYATDGNLRLSHSGCLGACSFGPAVTCYFQRDGGLHQAWYHGMDIPKTMALARSLHANDSLPTEGRYDE